MATLEELVIKVDSDTTGAESGLENLEDTADTSFKNVERSSEEGFSNLADSADNAEQKAMGFRDTLTGVQDTAMGTSEILKGNLAGGFLTLGAGIGDLASGFSNLLIPALGKSVAWLKTTKVGMLAQAAVTKVVTAAQWLWNAALSANPIGLIIIAIVALIAVFVLLWKNSETFRNIVLGVWEAVQKGAKFLWEGIKKYFSFWKGMFDKVIGWITGVWDTAKKNFNNIVGFVKGLPSRIASAASGMFNGIWDAFKRGINRVIGGWNNLSFSLPSVTILGKTIGGFTLNTPNIPFLARGGIVTDPTLAMLGEGGRDEAVIPLPNGMKNLGQGGGGTLTLVSDGTRASDFLIEILEESLRTNPEFRSRFEVGR